MTDQADDDQPATSCVSAEQLERVAQIRRRRVESAGTGSARQRSEAPTAEAPPAESAPAGRPDKRSKRRKHVAQGSRIVAAGLGATTMFGIVTMFGIGTPASGAEVTTSPASGVQPPSPDPVVVAAPPVQIVIHRIPARVDSQAAAEPPDVTVEPASSIEAPAPAPAPAPDPVTPAAVQLTANPVVQTVTVAAPSQPRPQASSPAPRQAPAPAPAATTSGSN